MKSKVASLAICALLVLPLVAVAAPATAAKARPAPSWTQVLSMVWHNVLPTWAAPAAPARPLAQRPHGYHGVILRPGCDQGAVVNPNGQCL